MRHNAPDVLELCQSCCSAGRAAIIASRKGRAVKIDEKRLRAYLRFHLAEGIGSVLFARLIEAYGDIEAVEAAGPSGWRRVEGIGPKTAEAIAAVTDELIDQELRHVEKHNVEILTLEDEAYPAALKTICDPPAVLYVRGRLEPTDAIAVGIVGSRRCTYYGLEQAERFGQLLGRSGFTVVSGGARGIDTAAHRGALAAGARTIAVMGCGLAKVYPPDNAKLFERIASDGCGALLSELPMQTDVKGANFPRRNRLISGLSLGVLIVEAARRSGSLITARTAAEQGREVFAVPGRVDSPLSRGTNELIRDGAILVQNLDDILEHLGQVGAEMAPQEPDASPLPSDLDPTQRTLLESLRGAEASLDELVRRSGVPSGQAASAMTMLVLRGLVVQRPGNVFAAKGASAKRQPG